MKIEDINVHSLPSLKITDRNRLPRNRGLYFVLSCNEIIYVGMTVNFQQRLLTHHKIDNFIAAQDAKVAWFQTDYEDLLALEKKAISFYNPKFNGRVEIDWELQANAAISVKLPETLLEKARKKSKETGIAVSFIVRKAIEEWVDESKRTRK